MLIAQRWEMLHLATHDRGLLFYCAGPAKCLFGDVWSAAAHSGGCGDRLHADCECLAVHLSHTCAVCGAATEHGILCEQHSQTSGAPDLQATGGVSAVAGFDWRVCGYCEAKVIIMTINVTVQSYKWLHCYTAPCSSLKRAQLLLNHTWKLWEVMLNRTFSLKQVHSLECHIERAAGAIVLQSQLLKRAVLFQLFSLLRIRSNPDHIWEAAGALRRCDVVR
jgi:hypothetical protein